MLKKVSDFQRRSCTFHAMNFKHITAQLPTVAIGERDGHATSPLLLSLLLNVPRAKEIPSTTRSWSTFRRRTLRSSRHVLRLPVVGQAQALINQGTMDEQWRCDERADIARGGQKERQLSPGTCVSSYPRARELFLSVGSRQLRRCLRIAGRGRGDREERFYFVRTGNCHLVYPHNFIFIICYN